MNLVTKAFFALIFLISTQPALALDLEEIWHNFDINFSPGFSPNAEIGGATIGGKAKYGYSVKKVYVRGKRKFQRIDGYVLGLNGNAPLAEIVNLGLTAEAQISYIRNYDAKMKAVKARPRVVKSFPINNKVLFDQDHGLGINDSLRMEFNSDGSLGKGIGQLINDHLSVGVSASVSKGTRFLIDIFRLSQSRIRMRMIAVRNMGTLSLGASSNVILGAVTGIPLADKIVSKVFKCQPAAINFSSSAGKKRPVDTMMVDYIIDLNSQDGKKVYNDFMGSVFKAQLTTHFNFFKTSKQFQDKIQVYVADMDNKFADARDKGVAKEDRPVHRVFKGRSITESRSISLSSSCLRNLISLHSKRYRNLTSIRVFDENDQVKDYLSFSHTHDKDGVFKDQVLYSHHLWNARRADASNPLSLEPTEIENLTFKSNIINERSFRPESRKLRNRLSFLYPEYLQKAHFSEISGGGFGSHVKDVVSNLRISVDRNFIRHIPGDNSGTIRKKLEHMIEEARDHKVHIVPSNDNSEHGEHSVNHDVSALTGALFALFNEHQMEYLMNVKEVESKLRYKFTGFTRLIRKRLFKKLGMAYLMEQVPNEIRRDHVSFSYDLSAKAKKDTHVEKKGKLYNSVNDHVMSMLSIINNRSFDLSMDQSEI